jgi:hypothetical protein
LVGFAASSRTLRQTLLFIYKLVTINYSEKKRLFSLLFFSILTTYISLLR